jgi:hypothetical protein
MGCAAARRRQLRTAQLRRLLSGADAKTWFSTPKGSKRFPVNRRSPSTSPLRRWTSWRRPTTRARKTLLGSPRPPEGLSFRQTGRTHQREHVHTGSGSSSRWDLRPPRADDARLNRRRQSDRRLSQIKQLWVHAPTSRRRLGDAPTSRNLKKASIPPNHTTSKQTASLLRLRGRCRSTSTTPRGCSRMTLGITFVVVVLAVIFIPLS